MSEYYPFLGPKSSDSANYFQASGLDVDANKLPGIICHKAAFAHVEFQLAEGQEVLADGGAMIWMDSMVAMDTQVGDCIPACWRKCAGEACCQNKFTGPGYVAFSFKLPGDMVSFSVGKEVGWKLNAGSFVCGTSNIEVNTVFAGCYACICGGEQAFLTKCTVKSDSPDEHGMFYAGGYGAITKHDLNEGDTIILSGGCFFACAEDMPFELRMPGGCYTGCCGGEGLCVAIDGPGQVFSQNRSPALWNAILKREGVKKGKGSGAQAGS